MREHPFWVGFLGMLAAAVLIGITIGGWIVWIDAQHGEAAYQFIQRSLANQPKPATPK